MSKKSKLKSFKEVYEWLINNPMKDIIFTCNTKAHNNFVEYTMIYKYRYNDTFDIFERTERFVVKNDKGRFLHYIQIDEYFIREHFLNKNLTNGQFNISQ